MGERDAHRPFLRMQTPANRSGSIVLARDVDVEIDGVSILHKVGFEMESGGLYGLVGPNGSGKTTLMRALSGVLPFRGEILLQGRPIGSWKPRELAREMAFVRQHIPLSFDFSVSELVLMGRTPHKGWLAGYDDDDRDRLEEALRRVDLIGFEARSVLSLSGGELQRVFLAQALVQEARILLLDEPIAHLDVHYQFGFMELVSELVQHGHTALVVFHDLEMAARYSDTVLVMAGGRLIAAGAPEDVITSDIIARVFRMEASIHPTAEGLHIIYHAPIDRLIPAPQ